MKLAANISLLYRELPMLERIGAAARDGFDGVEILFPYDLDPAALRRALSDAALPLVLINTPLGAAGEPGLAAVPDQRAAFRDGLQRALDIAVATGCPTLHTMAGRPPADADPTRRLAVLVDNLRWAAPLARAAGVVLTLEALNRHDVPGYAYHQPSEAVDVLRQLGGDDVRLQFDLYHVAREGLDLTRELEAARPWIRHVQVADAPARSAPDLSKPAVRQAFEALLAWPYRSWVGFEYNPGGGTAASLGWREPLRQLIASRSATA
ncbi:hydroxypyruvate isomerase family protein [Piscinibacter koreensis]|uniref:TIM barrel protein n=1 Tax=Piscinibacter koreensis TaxID=2742824 RepID=A0A7Y6TY95_9BURK|nr:TIM barrel protein [Schlegelella koreensis]NUZ08013.1 TIM barrel protein [Schlegelella koreensis]